MIQTLFKKMSTYRGEISWVIAGQLLTYLGVFVTIKVLTNVLTTEAYGSLALGLTFAGILSTFFFGPLGQAVYRYYAPYRGSKKLATLFYSTKSILSQLIAAIIFLGGLLLVFTELYYPEWSWLVAISLTFGLLKGVFDIVVTSYSANRQRKRVALNQISESWFKLLFAFIIVTLVVNSEIGVLSGYVLVIVLLLVNLYVVDIKNKRKSTLIDKYEITESKAELYKYAASFTLFSVFAAICLYSDRWIINYYLGVKDVAIYAVMLQIANAPIQLIDGIISQMMVPLIFSRAGTMSTADQERSSMKLLRINLLISIFLFAIVIVISLFFGRMIINLIASDTYSEQHHILWVLVLGFSFANIAQILFLKAQNHKKPAAILPAWMVRAISFIILSIILSRLYGIPGMAYAFVISTFLYLIIVSFITNKLSLEPEVAQT